MIDLSKQEIDCALIRVEKGLNQYQWLQQNLHGTNVKDSLEFQKRFNGFYRVRRNSSWRGHFYDLLETAKRNKKTFCQVLEEVRNRTGRYEASFASKLIATINPAQPVIDKFVLDKVGLKLPPSNVKNRQERIVQMYQQLKKECREYLRTPNGEYLVRRFKCLYPSANITEVKMLDLVLWQVR